MSGAWHKAGEVRSVNPARRELRVRIDRGRASAFEDCVWIWMQQGRRDPVRYRVDSVRRHEDEAIVMLAAGVPRDEVRTLNGARVVTEQAAAPNDEDYALDDLLGLMLTERGVALGRIVDVMETPAHEVVEIERADGTRAMAPLAAELVIGIDFEAGRVDMRDAPLVQSAAAGSG
jgi:ribosomal 30S subunit maturation factor RimM